MKFCKNLFCFLSEIFTVSVCGLFNDAVNRPDYVVSNGRMIIEKFYYRNICREGLRGNSEKPVSFAGVLVEFELWASLIRRRLASVSTTTFDFTVNFYTNDFSLTHQLRRNPKMMLYGLHLRPRIRNISTIGLLFLRSHRCSLCTVILLSVWLGHLGGILCDSPRDPVFLFKSISTDAPRRDRSCWGNHGCGTCNTVLRVCDTFTDPHSRCRSIVAGEVFKP
jgi:hypothetical protein